MLSEVRQSPDTPSGLLRWSPTLDLRNAGPDMLRKAIFGLQPSFWEPWFKEQLQSAEIAIAGDDIARACSQFMEGFRAFVDTPGLELAPALRASGFLNQPMVVQLFISHRIGQVAVGMTGYALKSSIFVGEVNEYKEALEQLVQAGVDTADSLRDLPHSSIGGLGVGLYTLSNYDYKFVRGPRKFAHWFRRLFSGDYHWPWVAIQCYTAEHAIKESYTHTEMASLVHGGWQWSQKHRCWYWS